MALVHCPAVHRTAMLREGYLTVFLRDLRPGMLRIPCRAGVGRGLVFPGPDGLDAILPHEAAHAPVPNLQPQILQPQVLQPRVLQPGVLQFFGHARPGTALRAPAVLFADRRQDHHIVALPAAHPLPGGGGSARPRHARNLRDLT